MKQLKWTKLILETFLEESGINYRVEMGDDHARILEGIMRTRFASWTIPRQAEYFHLSVDAVNDCVKELKELYDATQINSMILPVRKKSKWETEADKND